MPDITLRPDEDPIEVSPNATIDTKSKRIKKGYARGRPKKSIFNKQEIVFSVYMDVQEASLANSLVQVTVSGSLQELCRMLIKEEGARRMEELKEYWRNQKPVTTEGEQEE